MKKWTEIAVGPHTTLFETMKIIDESSLQFAIVIDEQQHMLGTVTDGDIRRSILRGEGLEVEIQHVMNRKPFVEKSGQKHRDYLKLMKQKQIKQLPIVDEYNRIVNVIFSSHQTTNTDPNNIVILMAGGLGTRLRPLTDNIPKPMLHIGNKPILETIIDGFKQYGFANFILSVNYKKEIIQDYFQDGSAFDVSISYVEEEKRMGTAGALSLLTKKPSGPVFVMNGDLLTQVNFEQLLQFHQETNAIATMCVREFEYHIPYGVIEIDGPQLTSIKEKPVNRNFVNAGIYVLSPEVFDLIPQNEFYDMPDLFKQLMDKGEIVSAFPIREYWLDIGQIDDFERANSDYREQVK
ncbi:nucleotidyltransferase family protein [Psychrobacillus sp. FJAT-51614]|uniref:Nucleotidyltransferase family protein n=1 Tax=Psychrobacillus mangrovi TaxID=3117745 RepID=A0ABU8F3L4_9BACI